MLHLLFYHIFTTICDKINQGIKAIFNAVNKMNRALGHLCAHIDREPNPELWRERQRC